ncbi:Sucrase/ferredoxin-like protein [Corynebacterium felinum]|nr:Sucrase/ferredoxin-like protein [Corynebacterium felinum]
MAAMSSREPEQESCPLPFLPPLSGTACSLPPVSPHTPPVPMDYDPYAPEPCSFKPLNPLCSDVQLEPLPGTSKTGHTYVILEHTGAWSHDILDGGTFSEEDTARLKTLPGLYLIRKPGREGHAHKEELTVYLVFSDEAALERLTIRTLDELFTLDLTGPGRNNAELVTEPLVMVCTHAKRDRCCAIKGRPVAKALVRELPTAHIWECSHTKGHRFAPSMVLFPWGYYYGHLNSRAAADMVHHAYRGELFLPGNRGRGTLHAKEQAAEVAVFEHLAKQGEKIMLGMAQVADTTITLIDGRTFTVDMEQREVENVLPSCGDNTKTTKAWFSLGVHER